MEKVQPRILYQEYFRQRFDLKIVFLCVNTHDHFLFGFEFINTISIKTIEELFLEGIIFNHIQKYSGRFHESINSKEFRAFYIDILFINS